MSAVSVRDPIADIRGETLADTQTESGRVDGGLWSILSGLRFLFAAIVLITHTTSMAPVPGFLSKVHQLSAGNAVLCFFVVSGFSIAHSLSERPQGFYARRFFRIYPLFFVSYLLALIPFALWGKDFQYGIVDSTRYLHLPSIWSAIGSAFFLNGFLVHRLETIGTAWTLSVEVFFYLLAPVFLKMKTRHLIGLILASCVLFYCHSLLKVEGLIELMYGEAAAFLLWPWLLGFVFYRHRNEKWAQFMLLALGSLMITRWDLSGEPHALFIYVFSMALIIFSPRVPIRLAGVLTYLGELSYPLYIIHGPIFCLLLGNHTGRPWYVLIGLPLAASIAAYHLIDKPFRKRARARRPSARAGAG
jgi:peptidoglycan/LPS O-acetylase OafA/YrhL